MDDTQESKCGEAVYGKRIVAYVDIMGWSKATEDTTRSERLYKTAASIAKHAGAFSPDMKAAMEAHKVSFNFEEFASIEFSFFSDCFAVSAPIEHGPRVFGILSWAIDKLLHEGFLVRGGVALGDLYHRHGIIFGPALIEAHYIEDKRASYPRCLCSGKLLEHLIEKQYRDEVLLPDCCQEWVVNIACGSSINCADLMKMIEDRIEEESRKPGREAEKITGYWRYMQTMLPRMHTKKSNNAYGGGDL